MSPIILLGGRGSLFIGSFLSVFSFGFRSRRFYWLGHSGHGFQVAVGSGSRCSARGSGHGGFSCCRCCTRSSDSVARAVQGALLLDWERHAVGIGTDGSQ